MLSLVGYSIQTLPNLSDETRSVLRAFEALAIVLFTIEYLLRIAVAENRVQYVFSFFGIVDLLAILPFYLSTAVDLRSLRAFRLLRLVRILKIARYSRSLRRFHIALDIAKEDIVLYLFGTVLLLFLSAVGIHYFEGATQPEAFGSVFHSLWWAVTTLTTVGYGDTYPITVGGKLFTFAVLLVGLGVISVPAGLVASAFGQARQLEREEHESEQVED